MVELYTSEGCSSCPPADRWFSGLLQHPDLWQGLVPVAFHVDYWNYLGWEDRFATPAFGERQRDYRRQGTTSGVYTPGVIAAGQEWHSWRRHPKQLPLPMSRVGVLELRNNGEQFSASFAPANDTVKTALQLHVAVLGFGINTPVKSGENRGRELEHDFVVLSHDVFASDDLQWSGKIPKPVYADQAERLALVAWLSSPDRLGPIQAVGGWR